MFSFKIIKKSKRSRARLGIIKTAHGEVETPTLVPVATSAAVKALTGKQTEETGSKILIANTLHLHLKPGETAIKKAGGLHHFMNWKHPLMTDSGGFQVFSLGFGRDFGLGKILREKKKEKIKAGQKPKFLKITDEGVLFTSFVDGKKIFLGPKESMKIQSGLGADIIFAFDECTPPTATKEYTEAALLRTHLWARICLQNKNPRQALYGIVQGGKFKNLRRLAARTIGAMNFEGMGIGGEFGDDKKLLISMLKTVINELPEARPRHLLGIGRPEDIIHIIKEGVDTFDCTVPTHYARHGTAFTSKGPLNLNQLHFLKEFAPLEQNCRCFVCQEHTRSYLAHLVRAKEMTAASLLTFHNLFYFHHLVAEARQLIKRGLI